MQGGWAINVIIRIRIRIMTSRQPGGMLGGREGGGVMGGGLGGVLCRVSTKTDRNVMGRGPKGSCEKLQDIHLTGMCKVAQNPLEWDSL